MLPDHKPGGYEAGGCRCENCRSLHAQRARNTYEKNKIKQQEHEIEFYKLKAEVLELRAALAAATGQEVSAS